MAERRGNNGSNTAGYIIAALLSEFPRPKTKGICKSILLKEKSTSKGVSSIIDFWFSDKIDTAYNTISLLRTAKEEDDDGQELDKEEQQQQQTIYRLIS